MIRREGDSDWIRWMADQRGSEEGAWCLVVVGGGGGKGRDRPERCAEVEDELKLVLRLMSAVVTVVVVVEAKLRLWRSSVRSSSHGSIALALCLTKYFSKLGECFLILIWVWYDISGVWEWVEEGESESKGRWKCYSCWKWVFVKTGEMEEITLGLKSFWKWVFLHFHFRF